MIYILFKPPVTSLRTKRPTIEVEHITSVTNKALIFLLILSLPQSIRFDFYFGYGTLTMI